jgi:hypothetical protein
MSWLQQLRRCTTQARAWPHAGGEAHQPMSQITRSIPINPTSPCAAGSLVKDVESDTDFESEIKQLAREPSANNTSNFALQRTSPACMIYAPHRRKYQPMARAAGSRPASAAPAQNKTPVMSAVRMPRMHSAPCAPPRDWRGGRCGLHREVVRALQGGGADLRGPQQRVPQRRLSFEGPGTRPGGA